MTGSFATRIFRIVFILAGCYNLAFGLWAALWPNQFFDLFAIATPRYPVIWSCLGMIVGLYGLLYWHAAWKQDTAWPIIAVGLLGKVLGPIGMAMNVGPHWPLRLAMINVFNDAIWWAPFALFLIRGAKLANRIVRGAPWICAICHILGLLGILVALRPALGTEPDLSIRAGYIAQHAWLWASGWIFWMLAAASLVGFYAWWGSHLANSTAATIAVLIAAAAAVGDFGAESLSAFVLVGRAAPLADPEAFRHTEWITFCVTAGVDNLLYTVAGVVLTLVTPNLPARVRAAMWGSWIAGLGMTVAAFSNSANGVVAATVVLFPLLLAWIIWMGCRGKPA